jgi:hypothetical protein
MLRDLTTLRTFEDIRLFYFKYKDSPEFSLLGVSLLILVGVIIVWKGIMPQTHDWFSVQDEIKATKERITQLQTNQSLITGISQTQLDKDYAAAATALPYQKDYGGMIESIDGATSVSNMERNDYSIEVGNLSTKSAQLSPQTTITVKVSLQGDAAKLQKFLAQLTKELPLSEVVSIEYNDSAVNIEVNFFYKYLSPSTKFPYTDPIRVLSQSHQKLLRDLIKWKDEQSSLNTPNFLPTETATPSGI